ncbi:MAG TPA: hypothetical protein VG714_08820 [Acidobacteriaceae bacterium]|nr:hypothetical protein [Acidobacteriaceae bacterium]
MTARLRRRATAGISVSLAAALLLLPLTGCHSGTDPTPENFIAGLNAYFAEHPDCLFPDPPSFPYETADAEKTRQMDALVTSKLLTVARAPKLHVSRYMLTDAGTRLAPRFCFGHRVVTGIDSSTPPTKGQGYPSTHVAYHYTMQDVPVWARTDQMRAAFPTMAHEIGGTSSATATLGATLQNWQVLTAD